MPYKSKKQAAYMHIHEPKIAKRWDAEAKRKGQKAVAPKKGKKKR